MPVSFAIAFALGSLVCAGLNDVVFKRFAVRSGFRGLYLAGIGLVWLCLQGLWLLYTGQGLLLDETSLVAGLVCGGLLAASNILLIESLSHIDVGLGSMIYRLNTVAVVVLSVLLLDESLSSCKAGGIVAGIVAVFLLYRRSGHAGDVYSGFGLFFSLAILASLFRALYGVASKLALQEGASMQTMLVVTAASWVAGGLLYAIIRGRYRPDRQAARPLAVYSVASGLLVFLIVNLLLRAVELGEASVVIPVANLSFIFAMLLSVVLRMEGFTLRKALALAVSVLSLVLLARSPC